jgi:general nucleoside transport system permease protein
MIIELFTANVLIGVLSSGIRLATPYLYAGLGEAFGQRSGVLNLGVEGQMLMGAFVAFYVTWLTGSPWFGLLAAMGTGALMGLGMAFISVTMKAEQGISGIGVYLFGLGLSDLLYQKTIGTIQTIQPFPPLQIPGLADSASPMLRAISDIFLSHNILVYIAFALVPISTFVLNKTTLGLKIRAAGQNPQAADTLGVSVTGIRYFTVTLGGLLSGVAGASLSIALLNVFQQNMTAGLGFIAVALVYFGAWRPYGVLLGAMVFSLINALQLWVQVKAIPIPSDIAVMMPYLLTILALVFAVRRVQQPAALTKVFERGEQ